MSSIVRSADFSNGHLSVKTSSFSFSREILAEMVAIKNKIRKEFRMHLLAGKSEAFVVLKRVNTAESILVENSCHSFLLLGREEALDTFFSSLSGLISREDKSREEVAVLSFRAYSGFLRKEIALSVVSELFPRLEFSERKNLCIELLRAERLILRCQNQKKHLCVLSNEEGKALASLEGGKEQGTMVTANKLIDLKRFFKSVDKVFREISGERLF